MYFVYFLKSLKNNKVYVGRTQKVVEIRLSEHNLGCNKWTRENGPFVLLYYERYYCKRDVIEREKFYKSGFGRVIRDIIISSVSVISAMG